MKYLRIIVVTLILFACGDSPETLETKKATLKSLKEQASDLKTQISSLEKEIATLDTISEGGIAVHVLSLEATTFQHFIEQPFFYRSVIVLYNSIDMDQIICYA